MPIVKRVSDITPSGFHLLGGKAKGLIWLQKQGFSVPEFLVIPGDHIEQILPKDFSFDPESYQKMILSENYAHFLENELKSLDPQWFSSVAVRSSAIGEDGAADSFAGIHDSVLNVNGLEDLRKAIQKVMISAVSPVALKYREQRGQKENRILMSVVIQKMVKAQKAGVAFGYNPTTGDVREVWISYTDGLADKLVSGEIDAQEFVFRQNQKCEDSLLQEVGEITQKISQQKNFPQDVEWAHDGQKLWLVQARAVTADIHTLSEEITVFDNSNIQESYCGVTTPLTFTYASMAYTRVYEQLMRLMKMSEDEIVEARWSIRNMLGYVEGRVYYNINNWYRGLLYMPSFGKRKEEMEDMMGLENPVEFIQNQDLSRWEKIKRLPRMIRLYIYMIYKFARMDHWVKDFDETFWSIYRTVDQRQLYKKNDFEIFNMIRFYQDKFLEKWGIPVLNDTKVMMAMGSVKRMLAKFNAEHDLKSIAYGMEIESVRPTLEIHRLSKVVGNNKTLKDLFMATRGDHLIETLRVFYPEVHQQVETYIDLYGDRCMGELKLETVTIRQDPEILFSMIRNYLLNGLDQKENLFGIHDTENAVFQSVAAQMNSFKKWLFKIRTERLKKSIAQREMMRLHRTRNFGLMRSLYLELGKRWKSRKIIGNHRDIFYLTYDEIFEIGCGRMSTRGIQSLIAQRQQEAQIYEKSKPAPQVHVKFPPSFSQTKPSEPLKNSSKTLKGLACSQGIVEGEVKFVRTPEDAQELSGKILLAERTDPGWTPLFAIIKGVIVERGSMLSHSSVIAREMGLPAVVSVPHVTSLLKDGDWIRLNGNDGTIEILQRQPSREGQPAVQI